MRARMDDLLAIPQCPSCGTPMRSRAAASPPGLQTYNCPPCGLTVTETEAPAVRSDNTTAEQNIQQFRRRLEYGAEEVTRSVLLKLLLADEKMLGLTDQQLQRTDRHIAKLRQLISQQTTRIERLASFGIGTEGNRLILTTLNDLMATYQIHRQRITATLVGEAEQ
jgi:hypothetical protein